MNKMKLMIALFGLACIFGLSAKSEAFVDTNVEVSTDIDVESNFTVENNDSAVAQGIGNTAVSDIENSVVIGDDAVSVQSNFVGAVGINRGDLSQSNSANITGNQETNIHNNDMRSIRGIGSNR